MLQTVEGWLTSARSRTAAPSIPYRFTRASGWLVGMGDVHLIDAGWIAVDGLVPRPGVVDGLCCAAEVEEPAGEVVLPVPAWHATIWAATATIANHRPLMCLKRRAAGAVTAMSCHKR